MCVCVCVCQLYYIFYIFRSYISIALYVIYTTDFLHSIKLFSLLSVSIVTVPVIYIKLDIDI